MQLSTDDLDGYNQIVYQDLYFVVPDWVRYVAIDCDGKMFGYSSAPIRDKLCWRGYESPSVLLCKVDLGDYAWELSLKKVYPTY